jgi:hypothetical protein
MVRVVRSGWLAPDGRRERIQIVERAEAHGVARLDRGTAGMGRREAAAWP